jgi:plastocyanin
VSDAAQPRPPSRIWLLVVLLMAGLALAGPVVIAWEQLDLGDQAAPEAPAAAAADGTPVAMAGLRFQPETLTVRKGATVVFDNDDTAPHTVTARPGGVQVDSGVIDPGRRFSLVASESFDYLCSIHPSMTARLVVES